MTLASITHKLAFITPLFLLPKLIRWSVTRFESGRELASLSLSHLGASSREAKKEASPSCRERERERDEASEVRATTNTPGLTKWSYEFAIRLGLRPSASSSSSLPLPLSLQHLALHFTGSPCARISRQTDKWEESRGN